MPKFSSAESSNHLKHLIPHLNRKFLYTFGLAAADFHGFSRHCNIFTPLGNGGCGVCKVLVGYMPERPAVFHFVAYQKLSRRLYSFSYQ
jgi:hypothetical protein